LIKYYRVGEWELFDLKKDPSEMKSVYGDSAYAEITANLESEIKRLQQELDEPDPEKPVPGDPELRKPRKNRKAAGTKKKG
jgi:hypothetical protein